MTTYLRRLTPTTALAILALVIAMSSSATAALVITGAQIKNGTITAKDVRKNALTGKKVKNRSLTGKDLRKNAIKGKHVKDGSLTGSDVRFGSLTGEHLKDGSVTVTDLSRNVVETLGGGASGFEVVTVTSPAVLPLQTTTVSGACPTGKVAVGANAYWVGESNLVSPQVRRNGPGGFTAKGSFPVNVVGADSIQLQLTCLTAG